MDPELTDAQRETLRFAEIVLGVELSEDAPPPDSPLGRSLALHERFKAGEISERDYSDALREHLRSELDKLEN